MAGFYTFNATELPNAKQCKLGNGTLVYYNKPGLDCSCLAPISTAPDFGGVTIIVAFLLMSFITIAVSTIPTIYSISREWKRTEGPRRFWRWLWAIIQFEENHVDRPTGSLNYPTRFSIAPTPRGTSLRDSASAATDESSDSKQPLPASRPYNNLEEDEPVACTWARRVLFKLCDVQIMTGTAMMVAALADHQSLSFYDAQLASQYWWLCLNSWWCSRIDYSRTDASMTTFRAQARRITIAGSVALSIVLQIIITIREQFDWDPVESGKCYVADSTGTSYAQNIAWLVATCLFFGVITLSLFTITREWFDRNVNNKIGPSITAMNRKTQKAFKEFQDYRVNKTSSSNVVTRCLMLSFLGLKTFFVGIAWILWFLLILMSSVLVSGNSAAALEIFIFTGIWTFIAWWIIFLRVANRGLVQEAVDTWTFGGALICFLFLLVLFHSLDVFATVKRDQHILRRRKHDEEAHQAMTADLCAVNDFATASGMKEMDGQIVNRVSSIDGSETSPRPAEKDQPPNELPTTIEKT